MSLQIIKSKEKLTLERPTVRPVITVTEYYELELHLMGHYGLDYPCSRCLLFIKLRKKLSSFDTCEYCVNYECLNLVKSDRCCTCRKYELQYQETYINKKQQIGYRFNRQKDQFWHPCRKCKTMGGITEKEGRIFLGLLGRILRHKCDKYSSYCYPCDVEGTIYWRMQDGINKIVDRKTKKYVTAFKEEYVQTTVRNFHNAINVLKDKHKLKERQIKKRHKRITQQKNNKIRGLEKRISLLEHEINLKRAKGELLPKSNKDTNII